MSPPFASRSRGGGSRARAPDRARSTGRPRCRWASPGSYEVRDALVQVHVPLAVAAHRLLGVEEAAADILDAAAHAAQSPRRRCPPASPGRGAVGEHRDETEVDPVLPADHRAVLPELADPGRDRERIRRMSVLLRVAVGARRPAHGRIRSRADATRPAVRYVRITRAARAGARSASPRGPWAAP